MLDVDEVHGVLDGAIGVTDVDVEQRPTMPAPPCVIAELIMIANPSTAWAVGVGLWNAAAINTIPIRCSTSWCIQNGRCAPWISSSPAGHRPATTGAGRCGPERRCRASRMVR